MKNKLLSKAIRAGQTPMSANQQTSLSLWNLSGNSVHTGWGQTRPLLELGSIKVTGVLRFHEGLHPLQCYPQYRNKMRDRGKDDKDMPYLVEAKYTRDKVEDPGDIHDCPQGIDDTASDQPANHPYR